MLLELSIKNVALIDQLRVDFAAGLNVLTGETGAGKSIVVDAVNLVLGSRANRDLIRTGADAASVQALFDLRGSEPVHALLRELGIEPEEDYVIIARELSASGRSICRIDGEVVPLAKYRQVTELLVDIHGQHEHQTLMNPALHLEAIDAYGGPDHRELMQNVRYLYEAHEATKAEIERLSLSALERERRIDTLSFQIKEIEEVKPKLGEDEALSQKGNLIKNAEKIAGAVGQAYAQVYTGEGQRASAQDLLKRAHAAMQQIASIDERFEKLAARLEELYYAAQDAGYELGELAGEVEYDPASAERIDDRLADLKKLKRKYGPELSDVLAFLAERKAELDDLGAGDEMISELKKRLKSELLQLVEASNQLTARRKTMARAFEEKLLVQLCDLGMARTRFEVRFDEAKPIEQRLSQGGCDRVEFMISPNPGEPLKPLSGIASGGELARIMLAMKAISADAAGVDTMIFDEIDTGVSGRMAQVVGEKMAQVARDRQVICVTHLPQIAALGAAHYVVEKTVTGDRTGSGVRRLDDEGRVDELARLLSGAGDIEGGRAYAKGMLDAAQKLVGIGSN